MPSKVRLRLTMQIEYGLRPALHMIARRAGWPTAIALGVDKACDAEDFVNELRAMDVTPHVAQNTSGRSICD